MSLTILCRRHPFFKLLFFIISTFIAANFYQHYISHLNNPTSHWGIKLENFSSQLNQLKSPQITQNSTKCTQALRENVFGNVIDSDSAKQIKTFYNTSLQPPGVILHTKGGIGNQLFQYACSYALSRDLDWPLYIFHAPTPSSSSKHLRGFQPLQREFALDQFQIPLDNIIDSSTHIPGGVLYQNDREFLERTFLHKTDIDTRFISLSGSAYCQSLEYFRNYQNEIRAMFQPHEWAIDLEKLEPLIEKIKSCGESVVVHVRRGDFVRSNGFDVPMSYQRHAIRKMIDILSKTRGVENPVFFVFSDDIPFVREKLKDFGKRHELVFVSQEVANSTSIEEFYLMTLCKHIILPNSTYSWWAAYLMRNKENIVIASGFNPIFFGRVVPNDWFTNELFRKLYHPKEWIVIDPFNGGFLKNSSSHF